MQAILLFLLGCAIGAAAVLLKIAGPGPWPRDRKPLHTKRGAQERESWLR